MIDRPGPVRTAPTRDRRRGTSLTRGLPVLSAVLAVWFCPAMAMLAGMPLAAVWLSLVFTPLLAWEAHRCCARWVRRPAHAAKRRLDAQPVLLQPLYRDRLPYGSDGAWTWCRN